MALRVVPVTVGIGVAAGADRVLASLAAVSDDIRVELFARPGTVPPGTPRVAVREDPHPEERLVRALMAGEIDAAVRGTLPSSTTLSALKRAAGLPGLLRIAFLETQEVDNRTSFCLSGLFRNLVSQEPVNPAEVGEK